MLVDVLYVTIMPTMWHAHVYLKGGLFLFNLWEEGVVECEDEGWMDEGNSREMIL